MEFKDYYATLGVEPSAGEAEIKTAYRRLARKYHPDVSKEAGAEDKFKAVNEAYEALRDPEKRAAYDQLRVAGYTLWTWDTGDDTVAGVIAPRDDDEGMRVIGHGLGFDLRPGAG